MTTIDDKDYKNESFFIIDFFESLLKRKFTLIIFIIIFGFIGIIYTNTKNKYYDLNLKITSANSYTETKFKILANELQSEWDKVFKPVDGEDFRFDLIFFHDRYSLLEAFLNEVLDNKEFIDAISEIDHNYKIIKDEDSKIKYILGMISNLKVTKSEDPVKFQGNNELREIIEINFDFKSYDINIGKKILKKTIEDSFINFKEKLLLDYKVIFKKIMKRKEEKLKNFELKLNYLENIIKKNKKKSIIYLESLKINDKKKKLNIDYKFNFSDINKKINIIKNDISLNNFESYFVAKSLVRFMNIDIKNKKDFVDIRLLKPVTFDTNMISIKDKNSSLKDIFIFSILGFILGILYLLFEKQFLLYKKFNNQT